MDRIKYSIPNNAKYFYSVRLIVTSILSNLNRDLEEIEDVKVAVTESLNMALKLNLCDKIELEFDIGEDLIVKISKLEEEKINNIDELSLSKTIIECLVDNSYFENDKMYLVKKLKI